LKGRIANTKTVGFKDPHAVSQTAWKRSLEEAEHRAGMKKGGPGLTFKLSDYLALGCDLRFKFVSRMSELLDTLRVPPRVINDSHSVKVACASGLILLPTKCSCSAHAYNRGPGSIPTPIPDLPGIGGPPPSPSPIRRGSGVHSHPHPRLGFAGDRGSSPSPVPIGGSVPGLPHP
jgi:hypothetical protein